MNIWHSLFHILQQQQRVTEAHSMEHLALVAIAGTTILVPFHISQVTATHLKIGHP